MDNTASVAWPPRHHDTTEESWQRLFQKRTQSAKMGSILLTFGEETGFLEAEGPLLRSVAGVAAPKSLIDSSAIARMLCGSGGGLMTPDACLSWAPMEGCTSAALARWGLLGSGGSIRGLHGPAVGVVSFYMFLQLQRYQCQTKRGAWVLPKSYSN